MSDALLGAAVLLLALVIAGLAYRHGWNSGWQCGVRFGESGRALNESAKTRLSEGDVEMERLQTRAEELREENDALMKQLDLGEE